MPKKYEVMLPPDHIDGLRLVIGMTVYEFTGYDYGLAKDDTWLFREEFRSFTLDPGGKGPSFTMPMRCVREIKS